MTAVQQGSDESGEGLSEAERKSLRRDILNRYYLRGVQTNETGLLATAESAIDVFEAALATARRDADELRGRLAAVEAQRRDAGQLVDELAVERGVLWRRIASVERLADGWQAEVEDDCDGLTSLEGVLADLRAALANPSAAQGEGEA